MASKKNSYELPEELMVKIFVLLPVISLLRCKAVCKSWLSIILKPQFVKTHCIESQKRQPFSIIKVAEDYKFYIDTDHVTTTIPLKLPQHFTDMHNFICSCNGLVCVANYQCNVIYLWNPMTRRFKKLATPVKETSWCSCVLGLGFDAASNDYKILRIVFKKSKIYNDNGDMIFFVNAEIYSANEDSWKEIEVPQTLKNFEFYRHQDVGVFLPEATRVLYFEGKSELLSFDLHDEVFRVYSFPIPETNPSTVRKWPRISKLLAFEGSLAMIYDESIRDTEIVLSLWTLDGDCSNASWSKQFNLENRLMNDHIVLYLGDGQFVVAQHSRYPCAWIFSYYKKKRPRMYLRRPNEIMLILVVKYNESLVSLEGFEQLE